MKDISFPKAFIKIACSFIKTGQYKLDNLDEILTKTSDALSIFSQKYQEQQNLHHLYEDHFVCLKCNHSVVLLNKHLKQCHSMTMDEYKKEFQLANDYPSVPKS